MKPNDALAKVINGESWNAFCDALKDIGSDVLQNSSADELERAEGFRYLARLTSQLLGQNIDPAPLSPPEIRYSTARIGANNPDFMYGSCRIRGSATYRIRGRYNDAHNFNIGAFHGRLGTPQGLQRSGFLAKSDIKLEVDGSFEIIASCDPQPGNWLQLCDESNQFTVRQTILNPGKDQPAELKVEVMAGDVTMPPQVLCAAELDSKLGMSALMVHGIVKQFIGWSNDFRERPNEIHRLKPELDGLAKGDPNAQINYGYFDIAMDEALLIRLQPPSCDYWNIQLANHWLESLDSTDVTSSINLANALPSADGTVNVVVSLQDPGLPNWLNTQGHERGVIALRWVGAEPQAEPAVIHCKRAELKEILRS